MRKISHINSFFWLAARGFIAALALYTFQLSSAPRVEAQDAREAHGLVYAVTDGGDLLWHKHLGLIDGTFMWAGSGKNVGTGWNVKHVFSGLSGRSGLIYAVTENGDLLWNRHTGRDDGTFAWVADSSKKVGTDWNAKHVFSGGLGTIYAVLENGDLMWNRHTGRSDGTDRWASDTSKKVGTGWNAKHVFSGGLGTIYAVLENGDLMWNRHTGQNDGTFEWQANTSIKVGTGWNAKHVFSVGAGFIYAVLENGDLMWNRHTGWGHGTFDWAGDTKEVGTGWNVRHVFGDLGESGQ